MTPSSALRSFAITLAIVTTIVGPRASGFTIHRTNSTNTTPSKDLSADESLRLQVKDDIKSKNENSNRSTKSPEINTVNEKEPKTTEVKTAKTSNITLTTVAVRTTTENVRIPTISSDTVEVFDSIEDTTFYNKTQNIINNGNGSTNLKESKLKPTAKPAENKQIETISTSFGKTETPITLLTDVDNVTTELEKTGDYPKRKTVARSILDNEETTQMYNMNTEIPIITEAATSIVPGKAKHESDFNITELSFITIDLPQTVSNISAITFDDILVSIATQQANLSDSDETQTATENINSNITEPFSGKYAKYTTIKRKQTTASEETTATTKAENDEMKADTSNTQINFGKVFNITPIPSLEKLRADLLFNTNKSSTSRDVSEKEKQKEESEKLTREVELTTPYTVESVKPTKLETVETKRAGYLDNSEKATTPVIASVSETIEEKDTQTYKTVDDNAATETGSPEFKKVSSLESQSQLAEDALQEEFLKEEALNNHKENAIRNHDDKIGIEVLKLDNSSVSDGTGAEDSLSVQPIERTKTTLYTLSPNYKPMKKIDVQAAKQFVRDPDDNSWRNESISSLGIVFKPKNSSKSFKEVLKNKTQTELNSLTERTKDDVPDLRVRLEKIAEVRKTKKKKMNKDGEVIYTDYEENSSETSSTPKPEQFSSIVNSAEVAKMLIPSNSQPAFPPQTEFEMTTSLSTFKNTEGGKKKHTNTLDLFGRLGLDPLTTLKPKKFFNIAEYYDTTDEYDADYVTMSKLDLKKFTAPPKPTRLESLTTKPVEPYIPERKPTVQYFPPREPAPVNLNNVDKEFERKINLFSFKDHPRMEPRPPFVTVPPLPVATAKPDSEIRSLQPVRPIARPDIRPTVKPNDFTYPPVDLNKNYYLTNSPITTESEAYLANSGRLDRGSYVIKHYKDFLNAAVDDDDRGSDFLPYHTTAPPREAYGTEPDRDTFKTNDEEDYDSRFRKEVLTRFVDNFNQNSERFKVDFPILYNNSVVHRKGSGSPASSRTFLKRLYQEGVATRANGLLKKPCEPNCELTVELSPAYELHYYVPNQEEREVQQPRSSPTPYRYGL